jgi:hypothetical protein
MNNPTKLMPPQPVRKVDLRLRAAAVLVRDLYEPGGELTEWTDLDAEDFLDETSPKVKPGW